MIGIARLCKKHMRYVSTSLFLVGYSVLISYAAPLYTSSNTTLDPQCAPTDTNCTVQQVTGTVDATAIQDGTVPSSKLIGTDITTVGTIISGVWQGTSLADAYIASAPTWNAKQDALGYTPYNATNPDGYISDISSFTTDDLTEGTTNLYFTNARAITALTGQNISLFTNDAGYITASSPTTLTNKSGNISQWTNNVGYITNLSSFTTDTLAEGASNLYFTDARAQSALSGLYEVPLTFSSPLSRSGNTISLTQATSSQDGYLSASDWNTFNNKVSSQWQSINGGSIYFTTANVGIGTASPEYALDVSGTIRTTNLIVSSIPALTTSASSFFVNDNGTIATRNASQLRSDINAQENLGFTPENTANKGIANGYASLNSSGKLPLTQLPISAMQYKGAYNAVTNTPALSDATGTAGDFYKVSVSGTHNFGSGAIDLLEDDAIIHNGTIWEKIVSSVSVQSVFGRLGEVVAQSGDYTTDMVTEGITNRYFTNARAQAALSGANGISYNNTSGLIENTLVTGLSGGQTITGSTSTTSGLILKATSGVGTTGADISFRVGNNGGTEALRIANSGNVGIGTNTPTEKLEIVSDNALATLAITTYESSQNFYNPGFIGKKARGTLASPSPVQNGDYLFVLGGRGYDGTSFPSSSSGLITISAGGTFSSTSRPSFIGFETTPVGSTTRSETMRIAPAGVGILSTSPTHSLTLGSTATGIALYNTSDQTTNFERALIRFTGGNFEIATEKGGTGIVRSIRLNVGGRVFSISNGAANLAGDYGFISGSSQPNTTLVGVTGSLGASTGVQNSLFVGNTISQTGSAGYRGLFISPFESTVGTGSKFLIDAGTNSTANGAGTHTSRFVVTSAGNIGIGTNAPTHALTFNSTSSINSGITLYNTVDQTTNFERARILWSTNIFSIGTVFAGTGTAGRQIRLFTEAVAGGTQRTFDIVPTTASVGASHFAVSNTATSQFGSTFGVYGSMTGGIQQNSFSILQNVTQTGTASYNALWISPQITSAGSGGAFLINAGTNSAAGGAGTHTSRFVVTTGGNVGIGTTTPVAASAARRVLVLTDTTNNTTIRQEGAGSVAAEWITTGSASGVGTRSNHSFTFFTNSTDRMAITATGNVGVGTISPQSKFHISADGVTTSASLIPLGSSMTLFTGSGSLDNYIISANSVGPNIRGVMGMIRARGTLSSPTAVLADDTIGSFLFGGYDGTQNNFSAGLFAYADGSPSTGNTPMRISFVTGNNGTDRQERLVVKADGKIGIGTASPSTKLDIIGDIGSQLRLSNTTVNATQKISYITGRHYTNSEEDVAMIIGNNTTINTLLLGGGSSALNATQQISFYTAANATTLIGTERMTITGGGNVGIATSTPSYTVSVGNNTLSGIIAGFTNSTGTCTINPTTTSLSCSSDMNLKKDITVLRTNTTWNYTQHTTTQDTPLLDKVLSLQPVRYHWNTESSQDTLHTGFIAQDIEQLFPELVTTDTSTGYKTLNQLGLLPYTIAAVQELAVKVQAIPDFSDVTLYEKIAVFLKGVVEKNEVAVPTVKATILCAGVTCVNEQQLQELLQYVSSQKNITITPASTSTPPAPSTPSNEVVSEPSVTPELPESAPSQTSSTIQEEVQAPVTPEAPQEIVPAPQQVEENSTTTNTP